MKRKTNHVRQVRNYIEKHFSPTEKFVFNFLVDSFPEHILSPDLTHKIDTSQHVTSINEASGVVKLTADDIPVREGLDVKSIEDALIDALGFTGTYTNTDPTPETTGTFKVDAVNAEDGTVTLTAGDIPFHDTSVSAFKDDEGESKTLKSFLLEYFSGFDNGTGTTEIYEKGFEDPDEHTPVLSINNMTGEVKLTARQLFFDGDGDEGYSSMSVRNILEEILSLEGVGYVDRVGQEHLSTEENQDILLLLAILAKLIGRSRELVENMENAKNVQELINSSIDNPQLKENNAKLIALNYMDSNIDVLKYAPKNAEGKIEMSKHLNVLKVLDLAYRHRGSYLGYKILTEAYLKDRALYDPNGKSACIVKNNNIDVLSVKTNSALTDEQNDELKCLLNQIKLAGTTVEVTFYNLDQPIAELNNHTLREVFEENKTDYTVNESIPRTSNSTYYVTELLTNQIFYVKINYYNLSGTNNSFNLRSIDNSGEFVSDTFLFSGSNDYVGSAKYETSRVTFRLIGNDTLTFNSNGFYISMTSLGIDSLTVEEMDYWFEIYQDVKTTPIEV